MFIFLLSLALYTGALLFIRPSPESLKTQPLSFVQNLWEIKSSLIIGLLLIGIYLLISDFTFHTVNEKTYMLFALNNFEKSDLWPMQIISHSFIHANLMHLLMNLSSLALTSLYERRVGTKRFLIVLSVAMIAATPSIFFYHENVAVSGISGAIFGLAAAYFTDYRNLTTKEWFYALASFAFLVLVFSLESILKSGADTTLQSDNIDHIGHILGAIGAIIFCRLVPLKEEKKEV